MKQAADCGIDALIVPDMPFEERQELLPACRQYGLVLIYLVAPTSRERAQAIARESEGFVYCVSSLGVTGEMCIRDSPMTMETLREICDSVDIPVVAIGGINLGNIGQLSGSHVAGAAIVSGI